MESIFQRVRQSLVAVRSENRLFFFFPRSPELLLVKHDAGLRTSKKKMLQRGY